MASKFGLFKIVDVIYNDSFGEENGQGYFDNDLSILLENIDTLDRHVTVLKEEDIRELVGIKNKLSSKDLIDFASKLRVREEPVRLYYEDSGEVTKESIGKDDDTEKENEFYDEIGLTPPERVNKFNFKKKVKKSEV